MFEAEEDGAITQMELAVILKTALGVTHLSVSRLFTAIDAADKGKITFGKRLDKMNRHWLIYVFLNRIFVLNFVCTFKIVVVFINFSYPRMTTMSQFQVQSFSAWAFL